MSEMWKRGSHGRWRHQRLDVRLPLVVLPRDFSAACASSNGSRKHDACHFGQRPTPLSACCCDGASGCPAAQFSLQPGPEPLILKLAQRRPLGGPGMSHEADVLQVFTVGPATAEGPMHGQHLVQRLDQGLHARAGPTRRAVTGQAASPAGLFSQGIDQLAEFGYRNRIPLG